MSEQNDPVARLMLEILAQHPEGLTEEEWFEKCEEHLIAFYNIYYPIIAGEVTKH